MYNFIATGLETMIKDYPHKEVIRFKYTRKVKFILGPVIFLDLGKLCSQFVCVASFIISKLPCSSTSDMVSLDSLCLNENFLSAPRLNEAIAEFSFNDFS